MSGAFRKAFNQYIAQPAPCDDCDSRLRCATAQPPVSCSDFSTYVISNRVVQADREPAEWRFRRLFAEDA